MMVCPAVWVFKTVRKAGKDHEHELDEKRRQLSMELQKIRGTGSETIMTDYPEDR